MQGDFPNRASGEIQHFKRFQSNLKLQTMYHKKFEIQHLQCSSLDQSLMNPAYPFSTQDFQSIRRCEHCKEIKLLHMFARQSSWVKSRISRSNISVQPTRALEPGLAREILNPFNDTQWTFNRIRGRAKMDLCKLIQGLRNIFSHNQ